MSQPYASVDFTVLTRTFDFEKIVRCDEAKDQIKYDFSPYESITSCIFLIVVNVWTGTPSNPSETLENVGIVVLVEPILADTDDAVVVVVVEGRR